MNSLLGENGVSDDYILPCGFNDIADENVSEVFPLRAQLDLNLDHVSRDGEFNFDGRYNEDETQIVHRGIGESDKSFFLMKNDIVSNAYQQFDSETEMCYISTPSDNITCTPQSSPDKCNVSNSEITSPIDNPDENIHIANADSNNIVNSISNIANTIDNKCFMPNSIDNKCYISDSSVNMDDTLSLVKSKDNSCYFSNSPDYIQNTPCSLSDSTSSITKTLRNIKRLPPPPSQPVEPPDNVPCISNSSFKPCYEVLSCTVLIDTSSKCDLDFNSSVNKLLDNSENAKKTVGKKGLSCSSVNMYRCEECGKQFREKSHLVTHSRAHTDIRKFKCSKCELWFKTEVNLRFHLNSHNDEPLRCPHCEKQFTVRRVLSRHVRVVHSLENFECEQCGKKFKTRKNLIHHYGIHSGVRPYSCKICSKSFLHSSSLNTHMREHSLQRDCIECNNGVEASSILIDSTQQISPENLIESLNSQDVSVNQQSHDSIPTLCTCNSLCTGNCKDAKVFSESSPCQHVCKPFLCSTCGKPFKLKSSLITHMKTHTPSTEYKCEECGKSFVKKVSLEVHMKQHRGERPEFMCDQCSQSYHTQFSLKRHYLKHTTHKNFQCQICNKKFWMKDALQVHLRSHTKERNFKCSLCDKCFSHKSSLVTHMRSIHSQSLHNQQLQPVRYPPGSSLITQQ